MKELIPNNAMPANTNVSTMFRRLTAETRGAGTAGATGVGTIRLVARERLVAEDARQRHEHEDPKQRECSVQPEAVLSRLTLTR